MSVHTVPGQIPQRSLWQRTAGRPRHTARRVAAFGLVAVAMLAGWMSAAALAAPPALAAVSSPIRGWSIALSTKCIPSVGTVKVPAVLIDFADYPSVATPEQLEALLNGPGDPANYPAESLRQYYLRSSYDKLDLQFDVLGVYHAPFARSSLDASDRKNQALLIEKALKYYAARGHDFGQYDRDHNGEIDYTIVLWAGPSNDDWWPCFIGVPTGNRIDGLKLGDVTWSAVPVDAEGRFSCYADALIHETGHALGLPDIYDLQQNKGPRGGVGQWDPMGAIGGDHGALSKIMLGWITPQIVSSGSQAVTLRPSSLYPDAAIVMPRYSAKTPRREFFIVQARDHVGNDQVSQYRNGGMGLQIWHVDAADGAEWGEFLFNNSNTRHKLIRLMEADGLEDIEALREDDTGRDLYRAGQSFGPATLPNSRPYWGTNSGVSVTGIAQIGDAMTCTLTAGTNDLDFKAPVTKAVVRYGAHGSTFVTLKVSDRFPTWTRYKIGSSSRWEIWQGGTMGYGMRGTFYYYSCDRAGNVEKVKHFQLQGGR